MTFYEAILELKIPTEFGTYSESDGLTPNAEYYINRVYDLAKKYNVNIDYAYGVSQLCFMIDGMDTVIKVAFNGMMEEWSDYDVEKDEYIWHEEFVPFDIDFCNKAYEIYNLAYIAGLENLFAKMDILGKTSNCDIIWTQEFVIPLSHSNNSSKKASEDSLKRATEIESERYIPFEAEWVALILDLYGEDKFRALVKFLDENNINDDFHYGNYGYTKEGFPMLLDYSGWRD